MTKQIRLFTSDKFGQIRAIVDNFGNIWFGMNDVRRFLQIDEMPFIDSLSGMKPIKAFTIIGKNMEHFKMRFINSDATWALAYLESKRNFDLAENFADWVKEIIKTLKSHN